MTATTATNTASRRSPTVGERRELGRYNTPADGERVICAQRVNGTVRLMDVPADAHGRAYLIERELEKDGYAALLALTEDYLAQAAKLAAIPLACSPIDGYLEHLEA
jgi:hypothetical protein